MAHFQTQLPEHGVFTRISDILSAALHSLEGRSVRVVGRVEAFNPATSTALLTEPKPKPGFVSQGKLRINTGLVNTEDFRVGSNVMVIGELEDLCPLHDEDVNQQSNNKIISKRLDARNVVLNARVSKCADRLDFEVYRKSVKIQQELSLN